MDKIWAVFEIFLNIMPNSLILKDLASALGLSMIAFERAIGVGASTISKAIARQAPVSAETVEKIVQAFPNVQRRWLMTGEGDMFTNGGSGRVTGEQLRLQKALGNPNKEEGIIFVPIAAQAGYSKLYTDPLYIDQLERINIPGSPYKGDKYRYFEVEGDSMEPSLQEGMEVLCEHVPQEEWVNLANFYVYVIVTINRLLIKRLVNDGSELILISDNEIYPQERISLEDVKELWYVKRVLSWRMPPPKRFEVQFKHQNKDN